MFINFLGEVVFNLLLVVICASGFWSLKVAWMVITESGIESFEDFFCRACVFVFLISGCFVIFFGAYYLFKMYWGF